MIQSYKQGKLEWSNHRTKRDCQGLKKRWIWIELRRDGADSLFYTLFAVELWWNYGAILVCFSWSSEEFGGCLVRLSPRPTAAAFTAVLWICGPNWRILKKKTLMITCTFRLGKLYQFKEFVCDSYSQYWKCYRI